MPNIDPTKMHKRFANVVDRVARNADAESATPDAAYSGIFVYLSAFSATTMMRTDMGKSIELVTKYTKFVSKLCRHFG